LETCKTFLVPRKGSVLKVPQKKEVMVSSWERETTN
jgi:hypothetical protein